MVIRSWLTRRSEDLSARILQHGAQRYLRHAILKEVTRTRNEIQYLQQEQSTEIAKIKSLFETKAGKQLISNEVSRLKALKQKNKKAAVKSKIKLDLHMENVRSTFDIFDVDDSGTMSCNDLSELFKMLCIPMSDQAIAQCFKEIDEDQSGYIDFLEFYTWWKRCESSKSDSNRIIQAKLKGRKFINNMTGETQRFEARKKLLYRLTFDCMSAARSRFRQMSKPKHSCTSCQLTFPLHIDFQLHENAVCNKNPIFDVQIIKSSFDDVLHRHSIQMSTLNLFDNLSL